MEECDERLDLRLKQTIDQTAVKIQTLLIHFSASGWQNAWPGDRESIGLQSELLHQRDILFPETVMNVGHVTVVIVLDLSGRVCEAVPGGFTLAVLVPCTLDLIRGRSRTPDEVFRKSDLVFHSLLRWNIYFDESREEIARAASKFGGYSESVKLPRSHC